MWDNNLSKADSTLELDKKFTAEVLGYKWRTGQASIMGEAYQVQSRFKEFTNNVYQFNSELNEKCYVVESPDSFYPAEDKTGATIMRYSENNLVSGIANDNGVYQTVIIGFPFESILEEQQRHSLMKSTLEFFSNRVIKEVEKTPTPQNKTKKK